MNPGELSYLQPACREAALLSNDERIHWLRQERWIQYPRAERILERLMDLVDYPPRDRMPCLVVYPSQPFRLSILSDGCLIFRKPCFSGSPFVQGATHGSRHGASDMRSALCASLNNLSYTSGGIGASPASFVVRFIELHHCTLAAPAVEKPTPSALARLSSPHQSLHANHAGIISEPESILRTIRNLSKGFKRSRRHTGPRSWVRLPIRRCSVKSRTVHFGDSLTTCWNSSSTTLVPARGCKD